MDALTIKKMTQDDIPAWIALSREYDGYVRELVTDLIQWYEGNETDMAFTDYMKAKIKQREAYMAMDQETSQCLGIIAFSKKHNRITFFGVSHKAQDYDWVGKTLMRYTRNQLNSDFEISLTVLKSKAPIMEQERELAKTFGFICVGTELENGVPVDKMMKQP